MTFKTSVWGCSFGLRVILYKRAFRFHAKNGVRKTGSCRKTRACFSFARNRNELRKNRVSLDPCRFSLTREKRERKKQDGVFKDVLVAKDIYLLHHDAQDLHAPKILKRHNTTTNSRFMIDLVAEMPLRKKQHGVFALQEWLVKNGPKRKTTRF